MAPTPKPPLESEKPFATIIVPVKDGLERLRVCVDALLSQYYPAERFDVIIVFIG
jgi:glycosyltransferase involved in cell wall biosynthesis